MLRAEEKKTREDKETVNEMLKSHFCEDYDLRVSLFFFLPKKIKYQPELNFICFNRLNQILVPLIKMTLRFI